MGERFDDVRRGQRLRADVVNRIQDAAERADNLAGGGDASVVRNGAMTAITAAAASGMTLAMMLCDSIDRETSVGGGGGQLPSMENAVMLVWDDGANAYLPAEGSEFNADNPFRVAFQRDDLVAVFPQGGRWIIAAAQTVQIAVTVADAAGEYPDEDSPANTFFVNFVTLPYPQIPGQNRVPSDAEDADDGDVVPCNLGPAETPHATVLNLAGTYIPRGRTVWCMQSGRRWFTYFTAAAEPVSTVTGSNDVWRMYHCRQDRRYPAGGDFCYERSLTDTFAAGYVYAVPIQTPAVPLDRINVWAAGGSFRLGVYANAPGLDAYPGALLSGSGAISTGGTPGIVEYDPDITLTSGLHWLVMMITGGADLAVRARSAGKSWFPMGLNPDQSADDVGAGGWMALPVYATGDPAASGGGLPATFPASASLIPFKHALLGRSVDSIPMIAARFGCPEFGCCSFNSGSGTDDGVGNIDTGSQIRVRIKGGPKWGADIETVATFVRHTVGFGTGSYIFEGFLIDVVTSCGNVLRGAFVCGSDPIRRTARWSFTERYYTASQAAGVYHPREYDGHIIGLKFIQGHGYASGFAEVITFIDDLYGPYPQFRADPYYGGGSDPFSETPPYYQCLLLCGVFRFKWVPNALDPNPPYDDITVEFGCPEGSEVTDPPSSLGTGRVCPGGSCSPHPFAAQTYAIFSFPDLDGGNYQEIANTDDCIWEGGGWRMDLSVMPATLTGTMEDGSHYSGETFFFTSIVPYQRVYFNDPVLDIGLTLIPGYLCDGGPLGSENVGRSLCHQNLDWCATESLCLILEDIFQGDCADLHGRYTLTRDADDRGLFSHSSDTLIAEVRVGINRNLTLSFSGDGGCRSFRAYAEAFRCSVVPGEKFAATPSTSYYQELLLYGGENSSGCSCYGPWVTSPGYPGSKPILLTGGCDSTFIASTVTASPPAERGPFEATANSYDAEGFGSVITLRRKGEASWSSGGPTETRLARLNNEAAGAAGFPTLPGEGGWHLYRAGGPHYTCRDDDFDALGVSIFSDGIETVNVSATA